MLDKIIQEKWLISNAVIGIFPAKSLEDDIEVYNDENRAETKLIIHQLRQQRKKAKGKPNYCLSDFIAPKGEKEDHIGAFAVTTGLGIEKKINEFEKNNDDYQSILLKALADRLAEAGAEFLHLRVRKQYWGYAKDETINNDGLIKESYQGIRPAPGYPACPDHTEKIKLYHDLISTPVNEGEIILKPCTLPEGTVPSDRKKWFLNGQPIFKWFSMVAPFKNHFTI